jgi:hypothetical protein
MTTYPQQLIKQIDQLDEKIATIQKEKDEIFKKLSAYKKQIEKDNSYLIGKKAMCINDTNTNIVECICTAVIALNDYTNVKPLFNRNGKKYIVQSYEWIS